MPHNKEYYLTSQIPYEYEPGKECPEAFRQFVADSFGLDMLDVIRAFTSMFLDPTAPYGRFPHLIGQSGGGKGALGRFWNSFFGEDGASSGNFSDIATAEGRHQYLTGKSLFSIPDAGGYVSGLRSFMNSLTTVGCRVALCSIQSVTLKPGILASGLLRLTICKLKMLGMVGHDGLTQSQFAQELSSPIQTCG
jgi:hypothetical protein